MTARASGCPEKPPSSRVLHRVPTREDIPMRTFPCCAILLSAFVYAILRGRLVPRSTLEDTQRERDLVWQAYRESEQTRATVAGLLDKVIAQGTITNELLNQLRSGGRR